MRDLTKEESEAYEESLRKISKPTGVNFDDLMEEKNMSDFEKFQKFFDDIGIGYEAYDEKYRHRIVLDDWEVSPLPDIAIRFYPNGSYENFEVYNFD